MENARTFTDRLVALLARERVALAEFLVALAEFDQRRLWLELGYASLFDFLHRELGLSKASASFRKKAADLIQRFPEIVEPLRDGRLCLTSVFELGKVLTPANRGEVLPRFFQLGRREAKAVAAALLPGDAPRREVVTPVRPAARGLAADASAVPTLALQPVGELGASSGSAAESLVSLGVVCPVKPLHANSASAPQEGLGRVTPSSPPPTTVEPRTAELNRLHVTVSRRFLAKLEAARKALSHSHPGASADEILEAGLDLLLERHAKRKGLVKRPRAAPPPAGPEHVPAHVRRAVWERDGGRCQWPLEGGGICGSAHRVELDHVVPRARGGLSTIENARLLCRVHNDLAARQVYGDAWMNRFSGGGGARERSAARSPRPGAVQVSPSALAGS